MKRKPGRPKTGKVVVTRSVSMRPDEWEHFDHARGNLPRGKHLAKLIKEQRGISKRNTLK